MTYVDQATANGERRDATIWACMQLLQIINPHVSIMVLKGIFKVGLVWAKIPDALVASTPWTDSYTFPLRTPTKLQPGIYAIMCTNTTSSSTEGGRTR